ncbi:MAG: hypothetical protein EXS13_05175 [Planctomycetes bacterium]|nr:hypothetical protein [Planctomycetota bacterium]
MPLSQVSARFFLELALGLLLSLSLLDRRAIGAGFTRLIAAFVLAALIPAWLLARTGGIDLPEHAAWLAGVMVASTLVLLFAAGRIGHVLEWIALGAGVASGTGVMLIAVHRSLRLGEIGHGPLQLASCTGSMAVLGLITGAMILGHWYLVTPDLPVVHLGRLTRLATIAAYVKLTLLGATIVAFPERFDDAGRSLAAIVGLGDGSRTPFLTQLDFLWLVARIAIGLIGTAVLGHMTLATLKLKATQPATGILYAATVMVLMGELSAFVGERSFGVVV